MSEHLDLQQCEPGDDPLLDAFFDIIREAVQAKSEVSLEESVRRLTDMIPEGKPYSSETSSFVWTCCEAARQIPYDHDSQDKTVTLIDSVLMSERLTPSDEEKEKVGDRATRTRKLEEGIFEYWKSCTPDEEATEYVNFQSFTARLFKHGLLSGSDLAAQVLKDTFEFGRNLETGLEAYLAASAQWIIIYGDKVHHDVSGSSEASDSDLPTAKQWRTWREGFEAAASGKKPSGLAAAKAALSGKAAQDYEGLREETRSMARRAAEEMAALERKAAV